MENVAYIANAYQRLFPNDTVLQEDAHEYLLHQCNEYDFVWSSPPCPTHSKANLSLIGHGIKRYPDMSLWQEIVWLKHFCKVPWVVENVVPYYEPLIKPTVQIDRHLFWSNFDIPALTKKRKGNHARLTKEQLAKDKDINLEQLRGVPNKRLLLRNAIPPEIGQHVLQTLEDVTE